jgi:hypothetical protein
MAGFCHDRTNYRAAAAPVLKGAAGNWARAFGLSCLDVPKETYCFPQLAQEDTLLPPLAPAGNVFSLGDGQMILLVKILIGCINKALSISGRWPPMLQNLSKDIRECYLQAEQCRRSAEVAPTRSEKSDYRGGSDA